MKALFTLIAAAATAMAASAAMAAAPASLGVTVDNIGAGDLGEYNFSAVP